MDRQRAHIYVVIMAGGVGSRFWPASRTTRPKQFLDMLGIGKSLIRLTFERFQKVCPTENIFVITNSLYKAQVQEHLPELANNQVICEPSRNNTAPCVAYAALKLQSLNPQSTMIVAPSDHLITDEAGFVEKINQAADFAAKNDALLTLGIKPHQAHTGYGYIKFEKEDPTPIKKVHQFTEKPDLETAKKFLAAGNYLWNAGIFIWKSENIIAAFKTLAPEIFNLLAAGKHAYNTEKEQSFIDEAYPQTPKISIDYAIMEKAENVYTLPSAFGWSDLGTWASIYQLQDKDQNENVISQCEAILQETKSCMIHGPKNKLIVLKGLEDYIVVDDEDVLLVFPKSQEQEIKTITKILKEEDKKEYL